MERGFGSAPGKVILTGEHSVVYGLPAIAVSIGLRCHVEVVSATDGLTIIAKDLKIEFHYSTQDLIQLHSGQSFNPKFDNISTAVIQVVKPSECNFTITINSSIPISAGLGSSAAVVVATIAALADYLNLDLSKEEISEKAFEAEKVAHGNPSGIDNSIATYGGIIRFENGKIETRQLHNIFPLIIGNTGVPRDTKKLVSGVKTMHVKFPDAMDDILQSMGKISEGVEDAMENGDIDALAMLFEMNQGLLEAIGVGHPALSQYIDESKKAGAIGAKLTGAGGGGCMIALAKDDVSKDRIVRDLTAKGLNTIATELSPIGVIIGKE